MPVEKREYTEGNGHAATVATECKFCGNDIPEGTGYAEHLAWHCENNPARNGGDD